MVIDVQAHLYDFEGDGYTEVVYGDEKVWVYSGVDGSVLLRYTHMNQERPMGTHYHRCGWGVGRDCGSTRQRYIRLGQSQRGLGSCKTSLESACLPHQ